MFCEYCPSYIGKLHKRKTCGIEYHPPNMTFFLTPMAFSGAPVLSKGGVAVFGTKIVTLDSLKAPPAYNRVFKKKDRVQSVI